MVPGDVGSGPLPVQPYPTEDVLRLGLSRGVSLSLPSSPMLPPRQPYMLPLRPSTKSPGTRRYTAISSPLLAAAKNLTLGHVGTRLHFTVGVQRHLSVMVDKFRLMILKSGCDFQFIILKQYIYICFPFIQQMCKRLRFSQAFVGFRFVAMATRENYASVPFQFEQQMQTEVSLQGEKGKRHTFAVSLTPHGLDLGEPSRLTLQTSVL